MTDAEVADALNREDELGKLVSSAFSFEIPRFNASSVCLTGRGDEGAV